MTALNHTANQPTLAVLPFRNLSTQAEHAYLSDGITEDIINSLANISGLRVISRVTSFSLKQQQLSPPELKNIHRFDMLVTGSVQVVGANLRVAAQLVDTATDTIVWSEKWNRTLDKIFELQDEISLQIADKLRENLGHFEFETHLHFNLTHNFSAYKCYLQGKTLFYKWNAEDVNRAIGYFDEAVAHDSRFIEAHLGLADAYSFLAVAGFAGRENAWQKAADAIQKALKINENHAGLNYMLANSAFFTEADYAKSHKHAQIALAAKPNYAEAQQFMAFLCVLRGAFAEAQQHISQAKALDPLNRETAFFDAYITYRVGGWPVAVHMVRTLLEENPKSLPALSVLIYALIVQNQSEEAKQALAQLAASGVTPDEHLGLQCLVAQLNGQVPQTLLQELINRAEQPDAHHAHAFLYAYYARQGQLNEARAVLNNLFNHKSSVLLLMFADPLAENMSQHHEYQELNKRIYRLPNAQTKPTSAQQTSQVSLANAEAVSTQLIEYMREEKPYLNPNLSLRGLAEMIDLHPNQLSWLLNTRLKANFNTFINRFRIEHFKQLTGNPDFGHISLLGLAFESGFNSKTVFNAAFKKEEGISPSAYIKQRNS